MRVDPAFDAFVLADSSRLLRTAMLLTSDQQLSEDLLQSALVRVARNWPAAQRSPYAYANQVVINLVHDHRRGRARRPTERPLEGFDEDRYGVADAADRSVDRTAIIGALRLLPARQREVIVLRFFADLSVADTATAIGCSVGTVKTHTSRALDALRTALLDTTETEGPVAPC
jgi:RNA polymerase sigma-70 factor (sigma-E family)